MANKIYTVEWNGKVFDVEGPEGATPDQLQSFVQSSNPAPSEAAESPEAAAPANGPVAPTAAPQSGLPQAQPSQAPIGANVEEQGLQGQFADQRDPKGVASKLAPEAEGQYANLLKTGTLDQITSFVAGQGRSVDAAAMARYVTARDKGQRVRAEVRYALPSVETDAVGAAARGALDTATFGALPKIGAGVAAATAALTGGDAGATYDRVLDENNAVVASDEESHGVARVAGQLAGGLVLPTGVVGLGTRAGVAAVRAGRTAAEARVIAARAITQRLAAEGAGYGAAHGALSADSLPEAVLGGIEEAAIGAAGGAVLGRVGQAVGGRNAAGRAKLNASQEMEVARAANRQGIDVIQADVRGTGIKNLSEGVSKTLLGAQPLVDASRRTLTQLEGARDKVAADIGNALSPQGLGDTVIEGARKFRKSTKAGISVMYDRADTLADGIEINPTKAMDEVNAQIAELERTPGGSEVLPYLRQLETDLANGPFSVADIRRMRTTMRSKFLKDGLDRSDTERRVGLIMDEAAKDIRLDLSYQGSPQAAMAYDAADRAYREYKDIAENVLAPIIGARTEPRSGYAVAKTLTSDLSANEGRAARLIRSLPQDEADNVRASIIGALGSGGKQQDKEFSIDLFVKHWQDVGKTAKDAFFGPEARAALDDLQTIGKGVQKTKAFANRSNTAGAIGVSQGLAGAAGVVTGGVSIPMALATAGGNYGLARWLASPKFARALVRLPREAGRREEVFIGRLARIARAEPGLAADMGLIERALRGTPAPAVEGQPQQPAEQGYVTDEAALEEAQALYEAEEARAAAGSNEVTPTVAEEPTVYPEDVDGYAAGLPGA